ncbi:MAG: hypothetical protein IE916_00140 [Epsilonproteobacteria bacterium]|nr:hypothetical protein [Campylobacterota bacterium]
MEKHKEIDWPTPQENVKNIMDGVLTPDNAWLAAENKEVTSKETILQKISTGDPQSGGGLKM